MSSTSAPFGLKPAFHPSGTIRPVVMTIASGYATGILQNQPIKIHTDGTIQAAAINDRFVGTFQGCWYTDAYGVPQFSNQWIASTTAASGTLVNCWVTIDPATIYQIQTNATVAVTAIGQQMDVTTITAGSTTTGLSALMLDVSSAATNAGLQIMNLAPGPNNDWGDTYVIVEVRVSEHQFVADVAEF